MRKKPVDALSHQLALEGEPLKKVNAFYSFAKRYNVPAVTLFPADYRQIERRLISSGFDVSGGIVCRDVVLRCQT